MNARQWAAVGSLGAVHLVADQYEPPEDFENQRVVQYRDKYFIAYLVAFLQRLTLQRSMDDAARTVHCPEHQRHKGREEFRRLHRDLLNFTVAGHYTEVSGRHAVNRFYRIAQQGLGVDRALGVVTRAVQSHEARQITDDLSANVRTVSQVQRKIEWLEIFFVSFYATDLAYIVSEHSFDPGYRAASVLTWPVLGGVLGAWGLKPWRAHQATPKENWVLTALPVLAAVVGRLMMGFLLFPLQLAHQVGNGREGRWYAVRSSWFVAPVQTRIPAREVPAHWPATGPSPPSVPAAVPTTSWPRPWSPCGPRTRSSA